MSKEIWLYQKYTIFLVQMNGQKHPSGSFSIIQQKCQRCNQKQRRSELKSSDKPLCGNMWKLQWGLSSFYRWWFILEQNREEDKPKRAKADTSPNPVIFSAARFLIHDFLPLFVDKFAKILASTSGTKTAHPVLSADRYFMVKWLTTGKKLWVNTSNE